MTFLPQSLFLHLPQLAVGEHCEVDAIITNHDDGTIN